MFLFIQSPELSESSDSILSLHSKKTPAFAPSLQSAANEVEISKEVQMEKREKDRLRAKKARQKKKQLLHDLEFKIKELESENRRLTNIIRNLECRQNEKEPATAANKFSSKIWKILADFQKIKEKESNNDEEEKEQIGIQEVAKKIKELSKLSAENGFK